MTIKRLAELAGVSHPTVSRALANHPRISTDTRVRIQKLAKEMGYRPDPAMSVLIAHRTGQRRATDYGKIAVLNASGERLPVYFREELEGLRKRGEELGYEVELFPLSADRRQLKQLSRTLVARGIRGVVVGPLPAGWPPVEMEWQHFSPVAVGSSVMSPNLHYAASNHHAAVETAYFRLRSMGYRKIGFFDSATSEKRNRYLLLAAYLKCLYLDGLSYDEARPLLFETGKSCGLREWLEGHGFDAVISGQQTTFREEAKKEGVKKVPVVAGFSLFGESEEQMGVREDLADVGASAMDLLHTMLLRGERGVPRRPHTVLVEGRWQDGSPMAGKRKKG